MNTADTAIDDQDQTHNQKKFSVFDQGMVVFRAILIIVMYIGIFTIALVTLSLVEIRQVNMIAFNDLIANLEQRDRDRDEETGLPSVLSRVSIQRDKYAKAIARSERCVDLVGTTLDNQDKVADKQQNTDAVRQQPIPCALIKNTIKDHRNGLLIAEDNARWKLAHNDEYYLQYIAGITQKMPQIIPALRFLDSKQSFIASWSRSSFELMEMFLLVSMGMLGGIISATRWLVDRSASRSSLSEYLYKPAVGGAIALGAFVVYRSSQLIIGGQIQDGNTAAVTASIYLLAGLGLVSGFCADKALRWIEKTAAGLLSSETQPGSIKTPAPIDHQAVPAP